MSDEATPAEIPGEACQRCGEVGEDRRTLWMACFYAMNELKLPFDQVRILGLATKKIGEEPSKHFSSHASKEANQNPSWMIPIFAEPKPSEKPHPYHFFTLRVCKSCRSDWMSAIQTWFQPPTPKPSPGSGIFVRENGATVEISREEWDRRHPGETPFTIHP